MVLLSSSAVFYALGWAILHSFWQIGILWVIYQLVFGLPKRWSPAVKHNSSLLVLFAGFAWFLVTGINHFREYISVKQYVDILPIADAPVIKSVVVLQGGNSFFPLTELFAHYMKISLHFLEDNIGYISAAYLFFLVLMMFRFTNAYMYSNQLKKKGLMAAGQNLEMKISKWAADMGINKQVYLFLSQRIDIPATIGFLKPVILLPVATINQLSMDQVESIILHELAHIRRMDYLWNMASAIIETILFFNPFVYLLTNVQKKERELCCDDFVLSFSRDAHNYAAALLEIEKTRISVKVQLAMASNGNDGQLLSRVKRILKIQNNKLQYRPRFMALLFITTLLTALAWLQPAKWNKEKQWTKQTAFPALQWMLENKNTTAPTLAELVREQAIFEKPEIPHARKIIANEKMPIQDLTEAENSPEKELLQQDYYRSPLAENIPFSFTAPSALAESQDWPRDWNFSSFEQIRPEMINEMMLLNKQGSVLIDSINFEWKALSNDQFFRAMRNDKNKQDDEHLALGINNLAELRKAQYFEKLDNQKHELERQRNSFEMLQLMQPALQAKNAELIEKTFEQISRQKSKPRISVKPATINRVFVNGRPMEKKVILNSDKSYIILIETDDESIEISIGSDTLNHKVMRMPKSAIAPLLPSRSTTTHSSDTYPRNRY